MSISTTASPLPAPPPHFQFLAQWNEALEQQQANQSSLSPPALTPALLDEITQAFVWESDPNEKYHPDVLFNASHLLGMLVCRGLCVLQYSGREMQQSSGKPSRLCLMQDTKPAQMSLKQLKDSLSNLLFEWPVLVQKGLSAELISFTRDYLVQIMQRFGEFLSAAHPAEILNDVQDTVEHSGAAGLVRLTSSAARRVLESLQIMIRHVDLYEMCEELVPQPYETGISPYHHEASMARYHKLCMHYFLPVAAKLQYKHDFPGMFNDVSQVLYLFAW